MKILTAKVLLAHFKIFNPERYDDGTITKESNDYQVLEFENGLILVEGETTPDWFFPGREEIEGNGDDIFMGAEETGETVDWEAIELVKSFGDSIAYFGDESCKDLVKELAR